MEEFVSYVKRILQKRSCENAIKIGAGFFKNVLKELDTNSTLKAPVTQSL
jgi:hypothetical protein